MIIFKSSVSGFVWDERERASVLARIYMRRSQTLFNIYQLTRIRLLFEIVLFDFVFVNTSSRMAGTSLLRREKILKKTRHNAVLMNAKSFQEARALYLLNAQQPKSLLQPK